MLWSLVCQLPKGRYISVCGGSDGGQYEKLYKYISHPQHRHDGQLTVSKWWSLRDHEHGKTNHFSFPLDADDNYTCRTCHVISLNRSRTFEISYVAENQLTPQLVFRHGTCVRLSTSLTEANIVTGRVVNEIQKSPWRLSYLKGWYTGEA